MVIQAATILNPLVIQKLKDAEKQETSSLAKNVLKSICDNAAIAKNDNIPMCQDTGVAVFFLHIGNELFFPYSLYEAIQEGTRQGYLDGYLRKSVVAHPLERINTKDNTPAIIHTELAMGDTLDICFAAKGAGSENMSRLTMLTPADGEKGVKDFVLETIRLAGGKPCPPIIVGIGIGGNFEKCAYLAKTALMRPLDDEAANPIDRRLENELLEAINALGIGPMAFGGKTTCLQVKVNSYPCHIASLPVAVNIQCHAARETHVILKGEDL
jgi:fumarate hydratase subunit alpha